MNFPLAHVLSQRSDCNINFHNGLHGSTIVGPLQLSKLFENSFRRSIVYLLIDLSRISYSTILVWVVVLVLNVHNPPQLNWTKSCRLFSCPWAAFAVTKSVELYQTYAKPTHYKCCHTLFHLFKYSTVFVFFFILSFLLVWKSI